MAEFEMTFGDCEFCKHVPRCGDMRIISRKIEDKIKKFEKELPDAELYEEEFSEADRIKLLLWELEDLLK